MVENKEEKTTTFSITLKDNVIKELDRIAGQQSRSRSNLISVLIDSALKKVSKP
jgi:metal-responsive CopG/Arc/MetJ family transcriptional regulator